MKTVKLQKMPYAQAYVNEYSPEHRELISYKTLVAIVDNDYLQITGLYSTTTRRHISAFLSEYGIPFKIAKVLNSLPFGLYSIKDNLIIDFRTGEVIYQFD